MKQKEKQTTTVAAKAGKFLTEDDRKAMVKEEKRARAEKAERQRNQILTRWALLIGDIVMVYMTLAGKIEDPYGVLFVVVFSVLFGNQLK